MRMLERTAKAQGEPFSKADFERESLGYSGGVGLDVRRVEEVASIRVVRLLEAESAVGDRLEQAIQGLLEGEIRAMGVEL